MTLVISPSSQAEVIAPSSPGRHSPKGKRIFIGAHQIMWLYHYYKNWDFAGLMHAFNAGTAAVWA